MGISIIFYELKEILIQLMASRHLNFVNVFRDTQKIKIIYTSFNNDVERTPHFLSK